MAKDDHLVVGRAGYSHHGIDLGNGLIIYYTGDKSSVVRAFVKIESIQKFADGRQVRLGSSKAKYSPDEIVRRAKSRLGEKKYGLIGNNCEQFVNWCRTGDHKSKQVNRAALAIGYLSPFVGAAVYLKQKLGGPKQR